MSPRIINKDYVMNELSAKVSELLNETIVKDAYIKQLEEEIAKLKKEDGDKIEEHTETIEQKNEV